LVLVGKNCGHAGIVEFDVGVVDTDEVDGGVCGDKRGEGVRDYLRNGTLLLLLVSCLIIESGELELTS